MYSGITRNSIPKFNADTDPNNATRIVFFFLNSETSNFGKTQSALFGRFDQLLVRMNSLLNDTRYDFLMKPKVRTSTESLTDLMKDLVGLGEPKANVTVLDLSAVPFDVVPMVTAQ